MPGATSAHDQGEVQRHAVPRRCKRARPAGRRAAFEAAAYEVSYGLLNAPFPAARDPERAREDLTRILRRPLGASHREEKVTGLGREFAFRIAVVKREIQVAGR